MNTVALGAALLGLMVPSMLATATNVAESEGLWSLLLQIPLAGLVLLQNILHQRHLAAKDDRTAKAFRGLNDDQKQERKEWHELEQAERTALLQVFRDELRARDTTLQQINQERARTMEDAAKAMQSVHEQLRNIAPVLRDIDMQVRELVGVAGDRRGWRPPQQPGGGGGGWREGGPPGE